MVKHDLEPGDPCGCGSRLRYADCHMPIFDAPKGKQIAIGQKMYADAWAVNADHYQSQGLYDALAAELVRAGKICRILDIGCGLGQGLNALRSVITDSDRLIVGVDENPNCLATAAAYLGLDANHFALRRIRSKIKKGGYFGTEINPKALSFEGDLVLVNVDLMVRDFQFNAWLNKLEPFDAVTLWFSGVHKARSHTKIAKTLDAESDADLRSALENQVVELAKQRVRPGGFVQLVNRGAGDVAELRRSFEAGALMVFENSPFDLISVTAHPYEEPKSSKAVQLGSVTDDLTGKSVVAISMIARARNFST